MNNSLSECTVFYLIGALLVVDIFIFQVCSYPYLISSSALLCAYLFDTATVRTASIILCGLEGYLFFNSWMLGLVAVTLAIVVSRLKNIIDDRSLWIHVFFVIMSMGFVYSTTYHFSATLPNVRHVIIGVVPQLIVYIFLVLLMPIKR